MDTDTELQAMVYAAEMAIEYLESIGIYDLRDLGEERFKALIEVITLNYHNKYAELEKKGIDLPWYE